MAKRDWSGLTRLIERHLSGLPGFPATVRIETRLEHHSPDLYHGNYFLAVGERELMLRMAKRYRPQRTAAESGATLAREAETLRVVARCGFSYPAPRLVCVIADDAGATVGLIETCLDGAPLSTSVSADGDFRLRSCAEVAAQVHQLPGSEFPHLPPCADSGSHVAAELQAPPPELFTGWPVAVAARDWIAAHLPARPPHCSTGICCRKICSGTSVPVASP